MYPILFENEHIVILSYYVLLGIGIFFGFLMLYINIKNLKLTLKKNIFLFAIIIFFPFVFGAKIGIKIENFIIEKLFTLPMLIHGSSLIWGFLFATSFAPLIARYLQLNVWEIGDYFASSIAIGGFFIRLGCLLNGCCFGIPVSENFPFATFYPFTSYAYELFDGKPLHPTQFYLALVWLFIFIFLLVYKKYKKFKGELIILMFLFFSVFNFIIEFYRYHSVKYFFYFSQALNILILILSILLYLRQRKTNKIFDNAVF